VRPGPVEMGVEKVPLYIVSTRKRKEERDSMQSAALNAANIGELISAKGNRNTGPKVRVAEKNLLTHSLTHSLTHADTFLCGSRIN